MARSKYASGKRAYLIDDRTGRKIRYKDARTEWTGLRVHKSEWERKHPQLTPPRIDPEPQVLYNPRPDNDDVAVTVNFDQVGRSGLSTYVELGIVRGGGWYENGSDIIISATPDGNTLTTTLGSEALLTVALPDGVSGTMTLGSETATVIPPITGTVGTTGLGNESLYISSTVVETGLVGTGSVGNEGVTLIVTDNVPSFGMSGSVGNETILLPSWGQGTWGQGTWGN